MQELPSPAALREIIEGIEAPQPQQRTLLLSFDRLVDAWADREAHQSLVYEATQANELNFVGRVYRTVLERWPQDQNALAAQKQIAASAASAARAASLKESM